MSFFVQKIKNSFLHFFLFLLSKFINPFFFIFSLWLETIRNFDTLEREKSPVLLCKMKGCCLTLRKKEPLWLIFFFKEERKREALSWRWLWWWLFFSKNSVKFNLFLLFKHFCFVSFLGFYIWKKRIFGLTYTFLLKPFSFSSAQILSFIYYC